MRRLALSLMASCGLAMLAACSGGTGFAGSGSSTTTPDGIYFTNGSSQVNDFFLAPSGNQPIQVNAVAYKGSGAFNNVVSGVTFTWQASYTTPGTTYIKSTSPNGSSPCGTPAQKPSVASILQQTTPPAGGTVAPTPTPVGQPYPLYGGLYAQLQDSSNPVGVAPNYSANNPNYVTQTDHVFVGPPLVLSATGNLTSTPVGAASPNVPAAATGYCVTLIATAVPSGVQGSTTIVVSNSP